jgi:tRNA pseudouridine55 synthase
VFGFINLDKPEGFTSHDCVACVRRILQIKRVGHGGTLDPLATGVLPIAIGSATRLLQFLPSPKAYRAKIRLGMATNTDDLEGEIIQQGSTISITRDQIVEALNAFQGQIQQVPPMYSAIQRDGKRLYELARQGKVVQVEPRTVEIRSIEMLDWQVEGLAFPELTLQIDCGPGTYIRAIARDLGAVLQVGGTLAQLVRTKSCGFELDSSISLAMLEAQAAQQEVVLIEPSQALQEMKSVELEESSGLRWCQGQLIDLTEAIGAEWVRVHGPHQSFLGVGQVEEGKLVPKVVLGSQVTASPESNAVG